jgi:predicted DNA binding protein/CheY-like chemotaxis protein
MTTTPDSPTPGATDHVTILYLAQEPDLSLVLGGDDVDGRPRVQAAVDPADALHDVASGSIDGVITENRLHEDDDGVPFVTAAKHRAPEVPVVVYAGDGPVSDEETLLDAGADAFYWQTTNPTERAAIREEILALATAADTGGPEGARYEELEQFVRLTDDAFAVHDFANGRDASYPGLESLAPPSASDFTIEDAFELIYEGDRGRVFAKNDAVFAKEPWAFDALEDDFGRFSEQVRVEKADGSIAHCVMRGAAEFEGPRLVKMYNTLTDVTPEYELDWKTRNEAMLFESESDRTAAENACTELVADADCVAAWVTRTDASSTQSLVVADGDHEPFVEATEVADCVEAIARRAITETADDEGTVDDTEQLVGDEPVRVEDVCIAEIDAPQVGYLAATPIQREGVLYGILTVFRQNPVTDTFERLLVSLATSLAYRHEVETQRQALRADARVAVTVELGTDHPFAAVYDRGSVDPDTTLRARELADTSAEQTRYLVSATTPETAPAAVIEAFEQTGVVTDVTVVANESVACTLTVLVDDESLGARLAPHACTVREIRAVGGAVTATVDAPPQTDVRTVVETIQHVYPEATFGTRVRTDDDPGEPTGISQLTAKQEEALRTAVVAGFFDRPQRATASDVAELLDVSRSTALHHIRNAERQLFADVL